MNNIFKISGALQIGKLASAPSNPQAGYIYYNTVTAKYYMYNVTNAQFEEVGLNTVVNTLSGNETDKAPSVSAVKAYVSGEISSEASARIAADSSLDTKISAETSRASAAESSLDSKVSSETSTRVSADSSLDSKISTETSRASSAESSLATAVSAEASARVSGEASLASLISSEATAAVSAEASARISADESLGTKLSAETSNRIFADESLETKFSSEISSEASTRLFADESLATMISAEESARVSADSSLTTRISTEESVRASADSSLATLVSTSVSSEASARIAADSSLDTKISTETSRASAAESSLATAASAETSARVSADASLDSKVSAETSRASAAESSLTTAVSSETSARVSADSSLDTKISTETSRASAAESSLTTAVSSEESARVSADASLDSKVSTETSRALSAESSLATLISTEATAAVSAEASARISADASLDAKISTEVSALTSADSSLAGSIANVAGDLSTEVSVRTSADSSLASAISSTVSDLSTEVSRAQAAESSLATSISSEASARVSADSSLDTKVSSETSRAQSAEASLASDISTKVSKAGDTMTGDLNFGGSYLPINLAAPVNDGDAVRKSYVDALISGAVWLRPIADPNLYDDSLSTPPGIPVTKAVYIVGVSPTGDWSGKAGHALYWSGSTWIDLFDRPVAIGDRFGVSMYLNIGAAQGGLLGKDDQIAEITNATVGAIVYSFTAPVNNQAVYVDNDNSSHFGHSYDYNGTEWVEFGGPGATNAGTGLQWDGNTLNVMVGAGIKELPTDEIGIDLYTSSGLHLTVDGTSDSGASAAQLSLKLDGSTLSKSGTGVKVADGGITNTQVSASAGIAFSKMAALTASKALVSDASGVVIASTVTATELGYLTGLDSNVQEQLDGKLNAVVDDAAPQLGGDLDVNGNDIEGVSSDIMLAGQNSVKRAKQASKTGFVEEEYIHGVSLSASQTNAVISSFTFAHASVEGVEITYKMKDSAGAVRIGTLRVATNGTDVTVVDTFADSADLGISFTAAVNGANVEVKYTSGATTATMRADVKKFLA
jgi:hypothetical protein